MNRQLKENKQVLRTFMRDHYTDDRLTQLLDHARAGKLAFESCCCFIGITTANHALRGILPTNVAINAQHLIQARKLESSYEAEIAFSRFADTDSIRRRLIIPIVLAEIQRRQRLNRPVILPEAKEASPCIG